MAARDLLFELLTEELPPRSLESLSIALADGFATGLDAAAIGHGRIRRFATPRRLAVLVERCAERQPDRPIERRGPPRSAAYTAGGEPTQAALAFARSCGVAVADLTEIANEKGTWLGYRGIEPGAATVDRLGAIAERAVAALPAPRRMRWGAGEVEFVRPVHRVVMLFGDEVVPCTILGLPAGRETQGHRFHAPRPIRLRTPRSYPGSLRRAKVLADFEERRERIRAEVAAAAERTGGRALLDAALLDEVTALVEWPVAVVGRFEERYRRLPREVIVATVQDHQRYFPVETPDGELSASFVTVANLESRDPDRVREGNERVVRPRLADAQFFWDQDRKRGLAACAERLGEVTFQGKLGSYADKTARVRALALEIERATGGGAATVERAAALAKADLLTTMVGEFPELQGTMGRYLALDAGEEQAVADAIEEQYRPRFAGDALPRTAAGRALALADKIDTLAGIFAIGEKPTGAKDPFGLRRAALGVLRILLETPLDLDLTALVERAVAAQPAVRTDAVADVLAFVADRLRGVLAERVANATSDAIEAVLAVAPRSPPDAEARLIALQGFLASADGAVLAAANKRISNLLRKAPLASGRPVEPAAFAEPAEHRLHERYREVAPHVERALAERRYADALGAARALRADVDAFFDAVLVMDPDPVRRENRLALLRDLHALIGGVADLSRLPG